MLQISFSVSKPVGATGQRVGTLASIYCIFLGKKKQQLLSWSWGKKQQLLFDFLVEQWELCLTRVPDFTDIVRFTACNTVAVWCGWKRRIGGCMERRSVWRICASDAVVPTAITILNWLSTAIADLLLLLLLRVIMYKTIMFALHGTQCMNGPWGIREWAVALNI